MKTIVKALTLSAVLSFACLSTLEAASIGACRYFCTGVGGGVYETYISDCCNQVVTCPDGHTTNPVSIYTAWGWRLCGPIGIGN